MRIETRRKERIMSIDFAVEKRKSSKVITIVYGGLSIEDNPTKLACERIAEVFTELGLTVVSYDLITQDKEKVLESLRQSAGVVLATTVEWFGIGYVMQQFLDECYLVKRDGMFDEIPLFSIVFSRNKMEKEASDYLNSAWQMLGGWKGVEVYGSFSNRYELLTNGEALTFIEKKAEQFYRYGLQQSYQLPHSLSGESSFKERSIPLEKEEQAKESAEMSDHKKNVVALSEKLKAKLEEKTKAIAIGLTDLLAERYKGYTDKEYLVQFQMGSGEGENIAALFKPSGIYCYYGQEEDAVLTVNIDEELLRQILAQKISFRRAFMTGKLSVKGELNLLYKLDEFF